MATRLTDVKSKRELGTTYSDKDVGRMVKSTSKIPGSVLRKTTGAEKILKLQGKKVTKAGRAAVFAAAKAGKGGFTVMAKKGRGGASKGRSK